MADTDTKDKDKSEDLDPNLQPEEVRERNLETAPRGTQTATGKAIAAEDEADRIDSLEDRGGNEDLIGEAQEEGDYISGEASEPIGLQAEGAAYATNGSVPARMVASPTGLVPVSAVAGSPEAAEARLKQQRQAEVDAVKNRSGSLQEIPEDKIAAMNGAEARAILHDRGYMNTNDSNQLSNRAARRELIKAQSADERIKGSKKSQKSDEK